MLWLVQALLIVLDPGHGGSEAGARGAVPGVVEKQATLEYARAVRARLQAAGAKVVMTREGDELVPIRERVRRANAQKADAFVSIHLNASPDRTQRGYETYVLSREAQGREAREMALREGALAGDVAAIRADLLQETAEARAAELGRAIQAGLAALLGKTGNRGLKQAPLDVLKGHLSPAALVEVGFIDHDEEGPQIVSAALRDKIAGAIATAILEALGGRAHE